MSLVEEQVSLPYEQTSPLMGYQDGRMYLAIVNYRGHVVHMVERNEFALEIADKLAVHHGPGSKRRNRNLRAAAHEATMDFFLALMKM